KPLGLGFGFNLIALAAAGIAALLAASGLDLGAASAGIQQMGFALNPDAGIFNFVLSAIGMGLMGGIGMVLGKQHEFIRVQEDLEFSEKYVRELKNVFFSGKSFEFKSYDKTIFTSHPGLHGFFLSLNRVSDGASVYYHLREGHIFSYIIKEAKRLSKDNPVRIELARILKSDLTDEQKLSAFQTLMQGLSERYLYRVPAWIKNADKPGYQIMIDRFFNPDLLSSDPAVREQALARWQELQNRHERVWSDNDTHVGGNLQGILDRMEYLKSTASFVYFNPIFEADTIHKYNSFDYGTVDHRYAGFSDEEFKNASGEEKARMKSAGLLKFVEVAQQIPVVIDIALNHTGRNFFAFKDLEENGNASKYKSWYVAPEFDKAGRLVDWKGWWDYKDLPQLDHNSPELRLYLLGTFEFG
ncbi:MAG TPA: alpha-amylase family glycosyl hydrolase, partial [bacterium]|nr:alpha-amylase family glycosyl hydrolase [bacterium]